MRSTHEARHRALLAWACSALPLAGCAENATEASSPELPVSQEAAPGYLLISPLRDKSAYLLDGDGEVIHRWESDYPPGNSAYLLDDGALLRSARQGDNPVFHGGGEGGRIQLLSWDGELEWDFAWSDETRLSHHDIEPLPNGNVLLISWGKKSREEVLAAGMDPELLQGDALWPDSVYEIEPILPNDGKVVWEWHLWDHLIQEFDPQMANHGVVADHPELVDLNAHRHRVQKSEREQRADLARMTALGYAGEARPPEQKDGDAPPDRDRRGPGGRGEDFCHTNSIAYNPTFDQIALSVRTFSELWIIDHSTTTEEARGHTGGRSGRGGDLLYRWGNPINYGRGLGEHQQLFSQHDVRWIPEGYPGEGNLLIFNNGGGLGREYSSVVEIAPEVDADGNYLAAEGEPFGPQDSTWVYTADDPRDFFSSFISGAERQLNGNTLICSGENGKLFEVNAAKQVLWEYQNQFGELDEERGPGGRGGPGGDRRGPRRGRPGDGRPPGQAWTLPGGPGPPPRGVGPPPGRGRRGGGRGGPNPKSLFRAARIDPGHPGLSHLKD